jgi:hypothetical protein
MKRTKLIRIDMNFDEYLDRFTVDISSQLGRPISKVEASEMLANILEKQTRKKKEEDSGFASTFHL